MSDPSLQIRNAQTIKLGLLAARSSDVIARAQARHILLPEDQEILEKAEEFLRQVVEGAEFIATGAQSGGSAIRSTEALGYALRPIESSGLLHGREVPDTFEKFAQAVHQIAEGDISQLDANVAKEVKVFFDRLYASLLALIEHNRLRSTMNGRREILGQYA